MTGKTSSAERPAWGASAGGSHRCRSGSPSRSHLPTDPLMEVDRHRVPPCDLLGERDVLADVAVCRTRKQPVLPEHAGDRAAAREHLLDPQLRHRHLGQLTGGGGDVRRVVEIAALPEIPEPWVEVLPGGGAPDVGEEGEVVDPARPRWSTVPSGCAGAARDGPPPPANSWQRLTVRTGVGGCVWPGPPCSTGWSG